MSEYIEREAVLMVRCDVIDIDSTEREALVEFINEIPAADVAPVVRGEWVPRIDNDTPMHECSVCGARVVKELYEYENPNLYCYHCGARMDGGNDG